MAGRDLKNRTMPEQVALDALRNAFIDDERVFAGSTSNEPAEEKPTRRGATPDSRART